MVSYLATIPRLFMGRGFVVSPLPTISEANMIGVIATTVGQLAGQFLKNRSSKADAKAERDIAIIKNQARLAENEQTHNNGWEMAALKTSPSLAKNTAFVLFATPIVVSIVAPFFGATTLVGEMWANLEAVPEYWRNAFLSITGSIYGLLSLRDAGVGQGVSKLLNRNKE